MKKKKIIKKVENVEDTTKSTIPATLIQSAIKGGADLDKLEKLLDLQLRWEANEAKKAYVIAMVAFQSDPPNIEKDKHVEFKAKSGQLVKYNHATLPNVVKKIEKALSKHNFSVSFPGSSDETRISVTCKITHIMGHSEETTLKSASDLTGGKNAIQAIGSAVSYLQRYTLLSLCGLATYDMDDDGKSTTPPNGKEKPPIKKPQKQGLSGTTQDDTYHPSPEKSPKEDPIKKVPLTIAQATVVIQNIIGSHLMNNFEKYRLARKLFHGLNTSETSKIIGWWIGDVKKDIKGERANRDAIEKGDESGETINNHLNQIYEDDCKKYPADLKQFNHYCGLPPKEIPFDILDTKILMQKYLEYRKMIGGE